MEKVIGIVAVANEGVSRLARAVIAAVMDRTAQIEAILYHIKPLGIAVVVPVNTSQLVGISEIVHQSRCDIFRICTRCTGIIHHIDCHATMPHQCGYGIDLSRT